MHCREYQRLPQLEIEGYIYKVRGLAERLRIFCAVIERAPHLPKLDFKKMIAYQDSKSVFKAANTRRTRKPPRSILIVCEQVAYRSLT